jgi:chromate transporter
MRMTKAADGIENSSRSSLLEVFLVFLRLGLTSFGGPIAHLGYFREEFVARRRWLDDAAYADLVALCQFLPGPASSQVGMAVGLTRAGYAGLIAAWIGFTLPSALALTVVALLSGSLTTWAGEGALHGLKVAAVAVVGIALLGMARTLAPDRSRAAIAVGALAIAVLMPTALGQLAAIAAGGVVGLLLGKGAGEGGDVPLGIGVSKAVAVAALILFGLLLAGLPALAVATRSDSLHLVDAFYRAGSLVFGGGHVVLPLLKADLVPAYVSADAFLAGYGAAQAVPGPLFTFAAYVGALAPAPGGWLGAGLATVAVFLPSALLVIGALPFWESLKRIARMRAALAGINAAVVGLVAAAFYDPVFTAGIRGGADIVLAAAAFVALHVFKAPAWAVVIGAAVLGAFGLSS